MKRTTGLHPRRTQRARNRAAWALAVLATASIALAQGTPSGEYGALPLGGAVDGTLAGIAGDETVVYHTYTVALPAGAGAVTVAVDGFGRDLDLAVKFGAPIVDYADVDHLDVSEDPNPSYAFTPAGAGIVYVDVLNLLPEPASYRLTATAAIPGGGAAGAPPAGGVAIDALIGTYEGDGLRVEVAAGAGAGRYVGALSFGGQRYPFEATGDGARLQGTFASSGAAFPFTAGLSGSTLTVVSGGGTYATVRLGGAPAADNPLGAGPSASTDDPVLARGAYGDLTQDNALAFLEALEFSAVQAGLVQGFSEEDRLLVIQTLAQNYAALQPYEQALLTQTREVWNRVQANWPTATQTEREEFVLGVFVLAFGEEAVQQAMAGGSGGSGGGGGGGRNCATIDDCMSTYAPEAYQDTVNAQGCWAAAGCSEYDPVDNSFTYESYDTY
ncbi:MAG: hypothetical protein P1P87_11740 [Trueperaceae bacterium]|nr:hypothetical protein [Trueperaceae bacterium]